MHDKLLKIQTELKAPKNQFNAFGKYKYRSCEDILEALKPLLKKYNLTLTISDDIQEIGGRIYVQARVTLTDSENPLIEIKDSVNHMTFVGLTATAYAREEETKKGMDGAQITGSASSYARKYALNGLFLIDDTKDADATNDHGQKQSNDVKDYPPSPNEEEII